MKVSQNESSVLPISVSHGGVGWALLGAFVLSLAVFACGNGLSSLWDRDETRFSSATVEMIKSGDWIIPHLNGEIRYDKPILIYWLMSVPMRLMGINEASARLTASVSGAATVALVILLALRMGAGRAGALVSGAVMLLSALPIVVSKAATTDAFLTLTVVSAFLFYWRRKEAGFSWGAHVGFWAAVACSTLVKGPPGPMIIGLGVAVDRFGPGRLACDKAAPFLWRRVAREALRWVVGLAVLGVLTLPWAIKVWVATDGDFIRQSIGRHVIQRSMSSLEGHGSHFFENYFLFLPLDLFPSTALAAVALRWAWGAWRRPAVRLTWAWLVPAFVVFSVVKTRLPHYMAPLLPAIALMAGLWWNEHKSGVPAGRWWWRGGALLVGGLFAAGAIGLPVAVIQAKLAGVIAAASIIGVTLIVGGVTGAIFWWRHRPARGLAAWYGTMAVAYFLVVLWGLPALEVVRPSKPLVMWVRAHAPAETELLAAGYKEASLVFYWQQTVQMLGNNDASDAISRLGDRTRPAALIIPKKQWRKWLKKQGQALPPGVSVRFKGKYYLFTKGQFVPLLIIGNW